MESEQELSAGPSASDSCRLLSLEQSLLRNTRKVTTRGRKASRWATSLLFAGSCAATAAFSLAFLVGGFSSMRDDIKKGEDVAMCFYKRPCESTRHYHAETVSELVSKPNSPEGKIFFSFAVIASLSLIVSRYAWELQNVSTGVRGFASASALRTVIPPMGMMIVAQIPVVPFEDRKTIGIKIACAVHTFGAVLFVAGYLIIEAYTLFVLKDRLKRKIEKMLRWAACICGMLCTVTFAAVGVLLTKVQDTWCCRDKYKDIASALALMGKNNSDVDLWRQVEGDNVLWDTATGNFLTLKKVGFWAEMMAGVFIVLSHFLIWYFARERHHQISFETMSDDEDVAEPKRHHTR